MTLLLLHLAVEITTYRQCMKFWTDFVESSLSATALMCSPHQDVGSLWQRRDCQVSQLISELVQEKKCVGKWQHLYKRENNLKQSSLNKKTMIVNDYCIDTKDL